MEISLLKTQFGELVTAIDELNCSLDHGLDPFAAKQSGLFSSGAEALSVIKSAFSSLWYEDEAIDGRYTPIWLGGVAVDRSIIVLAERVNALKDTFQTSVISARNHLQASSGLSSGGASKSFRRMLSEIGFGRLSLRMAYRHIPIITPTPSSIRFSHCSAGKSITKITPAQALEKIIEAGLEGVGINIIVKQLGKMPAHTDLAQVQFLPGYYKANLRFECEPSKKTVPTFLPMLYLAGDVAPDRQIEIPGPRKFSKSPRADRKLSNIPIVEALRIYPYLSQA